tara:strand:- start:1550 stop:2224 length:675 start_codon:yes stop_codon:yes gene_type:complete
MSWNIFFERSDIIQETQKINEYLEEQRIKYEPLKLFPLQENIYKCFELTPLEELKVVLIGQDPYHSEYNNQPQAQGLSFSVPNNFTFPPSLKNIFKELNNDIGCHIPKSGDLTKWSKQGVLLLNASLTVLQGNPNSHSKIWKKFTLELLKFIIDNKKNLVFILWGKFSQNLLKNLDVTEQHIISSNHPSPLSANKGGFFGTKPFSKTNQILQNIKNEPIDWNLD